MQRLKDTISLAIETKIFPMQSRKFKDKVKTLDNKYDRLILKLMFEEGISEQDLFGCIRSSTASGLPERASTTIKLKTHE